MQIAVVVTFFFIAATSALGGKRSIQLARATGRANYYLGALIAFFMALWCIYLGVWELSR